MVKELIHDPVFLALKSEEATAADAQIANDLVDTLKSLKNKCVGLAGNMIGELKRIIVVDDGAKYITMFNPEIIEAADEYETEESCLSLLDGPRKTQRFRTIKVSYQTSDLRPRIKTFHGFTAQIIQHEIDHCNGILI